MSGSKAQPRNSSGVTRKQDKRTRLEVHRELEFLRSAGSLRRGKTPPRQISKRAKKAIRARVDERRRKLNEVSR